MYVSAPKASGGVVLPPVQTKSLMNCAVSGWLDPIKAIMESRTFSWVVCPEGLGVIVGVGLTEFVGVGAGVGVGAAVGVGEGVGEGEDECVAA